ncbi:MAG: nucleoside hydrolase [Gudongella sp.]|nr:nucleoside hydrolase [Gudongella sp.]
MNILVSGKDLPSIKGTFLNPEGPLPKEWKKLKEQEDIILVLTEGPSSAALAFKVWPNLTQKVKKIIYAGGTLKRGDATPYAEESIHQDPYGMESLLNSGVPVTFCTMESAAAYNMTMTDLAIEYAHSPEKYKTISCGVHVETQSSSAAYGKMICDANSDNRFGKRNTEIII